METARVFQALCVPGRWGDHKPPSSRAFLAGVALTAFRLPQPPKQISHSSFVHAAPAPVLPWGDQGLPGACQAREGLRPNLSLQAELTPRRWPSPVLCGPRTRWAACTPFIQPTFIECQMCART